MVCPKCELLISEMLDDLLPRYRIEFGRSYLPAQRLYLRELGCHGLSRKYELLRAYYQGNYLFVKR